jgi:hypothetical protein
MPDRDRAERFDLHKSLGQPHRLRRNTGGVGRRELLHACGKVCSLPHRRIVHAQVTADRAHHYLAGIDPDPDRNLDPVIATRLLGVAADQILHAQCRVAGAHGMVLMGERRAEQRHDSVTHHLVHRTLIPVHRLHHVREHGVDNVARFLRIAISQELERTL